MPDRVETAAKPLILVVDDEVDPRIFLFELLESEGYSVATCEGAFDAEAFIARQKPAVVITDVRMPNVDGLHLLSRIRVASPTTRVILYSAFADWGMFFDTLDRGGVDLIPKGASNAEILRVVRRAIAEIPPSKEGS